MTDESAKPLLRAHAPRRSNRTGLAMNASAQSAHSQRASERGGLTHRLARIKVTLPKLRCLEEPDES